MGSMGIPEEKWKIIWFENVEAGILQLQDNKWKDNLITESWKLNWKWEHTLYKQCFQ